MIQKKMVRATDIVRILPVNSEIENYKGYYYDYGLFVILVSIGQFTVWNLNCLRGPQCQHKTSAHSEWRNKGCYDS